jgi:hypothetical protein
MSTLVSLTNFEELWQAAIDQYDKTAGRQLLATPYAQQLFACNSLDSVVRELERHGHGFKDYRAHGQQIRKVLGYVVKIVLLGAEAGGEAAAASVCIYRAMSYLPTETSNAESRTWWQSRFRCF